MKKITYKWVYLLPVLFVFINAYMSQSIKIRWFVNNEKNLFNILVALSLLASLLLSFKNKKESGAWYWHAISLLIILFSIVGLYLNNISIGF